MPRLPIDHRQFFKDLVLILGLPAAVLGGLLVWWAPWDVAAPQPWNAPLSTNVFETLRGSWGWTGDSPSTCALDPHQISFSADYTTMSIASREPWTDSGGVEHAAAIYDILEVESNRIRGVIQGEFRRTAAGEPVVWDLVLMDSNTYRWHRTDWRVGSYTDPVERCRGPLEVLDDAASVRVEPGAFSTASMPVHRTPTRAACPPGARAEAILDEAIVYPTIGTDTVYPKDSLRVQPYWSGSVSYIPAERPEGTPRPGTAVVRFVVNPEGLVPSCLVTVVEASNEYDAEDARTLLSLARYVPAQRDGRAVWVRIQDTVRSR